MYNIAAGIIIIVYRCLRVMEKMIKTAIIITIVRHIFFFFARVPLARWRYPAEPGDIASTFDE